MEIQAAIKEHVERRDSAIVVEARNDPFAAIHYSPFGYNVCKFKDKHLKTTTESDSVTCTHCLRTLEYGYA